MNERETYQTREVAHILQVTGTSVRRYCKDFSPHLSDGTRRKRRVFSSEDVAVLKRAQQLMGEGYLKKEINRLLYTETIAPDEPTDSALAVFPEIAKAMDDLKEQLLIAYDRQEEQQETIDALTERLERLERPWYRKLFDRDDSEP